jgi:hypothetical protein
MGFRVKITAKADRDLDEILTWLLAEGAGETGLRWFRSLRKAIDYLAELPARCSLAHEAATFLSKLGNCFMGAKEAYTEFYSQSRVSSLWFFMCDGQGRILFLCNEFGHAPKNVSQFSIIYVQAKRDGPRESLARLSAHRA